jgi:hypothetical protein
MTLVIFLLKITLVPLLIGAITLAGRRWGPTVAGWLTGLPVVAGPVMFFMAFEQGSAFAGQAIVGMLLGVLAVLVCNAGYAWCSTRLSWRGSVVCSLSLYFLAVALLNSLAIGLNAAAALVFVSLFVARRLFPPARAQRVSVASARSEIVIRMFAGAVLVLTVTCFAATFGAHLSGLFATFPVISTVLAVFSHRQSGHEFAICLLRGIVLGWYAFVTFSLVLGWMLPSFGLTLSFAAATLSAAVAQVLSRKLIGALPARDASSA